MVLLPVECDSDRWTVEVEFLDRRPRLEVVVHVAPHGNDFAPRVCVADAADGLPGEIALPGSDVDIPRGEPLSPLAEVHPALGADDRVPFVDADLLAAAATGIERTEIGAEIPSEVLSGAERAGAGQHVDARRRVARDAILAGDCPDGALDVEIEIRSHACRQR